GVDDAELIRHIEKRLHLVISPSKSWSAPTSPCIPEASTPKRPNLGVIDLTWDDELGRSMKRKREKIDDTKREGDEEGEEQDRLYKRFNELLKKMEEQHAKLARIVNENANTKREIKDTISTMGS